MLGRIKIGTKLISGFVGLILLAGLIGIIGVINIRNMDNNDKMMYNKVTVPISELLYITESYQKVRVNVWSLLYSTNAIGLRKAADTINSLSGVIVSNITLYEKSIINDKEQTLNNNFIEARKVYRADLDEVIRLAELGKLKEARAIVEGEGETAALAEQAAIDNLVENKLEYSRQLSNSNAKAAAGAETVVLITTLIGAILAIAIGIANTLSITKPVGELMKMIVKISEGDFSHTEEVRIRSKDEIGILMEASNRMLGGLNNVVGVFKKMAEGDLSVNFKKTSDKDELGEALTMMLNSLNELLSQVNVSIEQVNSGAGQVSSASQQLSQGASQQASSLEEITSSVTEINSQTKQNTENAVTVNSLAKNTKEKAEMGNGQMKELVNAMGKINVSAEEIKKIVKAIDDIAFQINLLALNANVEAARAGKYGKGFAVVAEEVRNLAVRSANSVKETTQMVEDTIKNIVTGNSLVDMTSKQLAEIVSAAAKVADLAEEVATASKEQTQGLDQISTALGQIDEVTQANTASAEESASASEELASQSQQLKVMISKFRLAELEKFKNQEISNEMIARIKNELSREHKMQNIEHLHLNKDGHHGQKFPDRTVPAGQPALIPEEVIALDDDNFGKF